MWVILVHLCSRQWKQTNKKVQDNRSILKSRNTVSNLQALHLICREYLFIFYQKESVSLKSHCDFIKPSVTCSQNYNLNNLPVIYFSTVWNIIIFIVILKVIFSHQTEVGSLKISTTYFIISIFILGKGMTESCWGQRIIKAQPGSWESTGYSFAMSMEDIYQHYSYRA